MDLTTYRVWDALCVYL